MTLILDYKPTYSNKTRQTVVLPLVNYSIGSQGRITMELTPKIYKGCKSCSG